MIEQPKRALLYARRSKEDDPTEPGVDEQLRKAREWAEGRGYAVIDTYKDSGISGWNGDERPDFDRLLGDIAAGLGDVVVTRAQDRISRHAETFLAFRTVCQQGGVTELAFYPGGGVSFGDPHGKLQSTIGAAIAEQFSELISINSKEGIARSAARGGAHGGRFRPYGYQRIVTEGNLPSFEVDQAEAAVIRKVAAELLAGRSLYSQVRWLNAEAVLTTAGGRWYPRTLRRVMVNPTLTGYRLHNGELIKGTWQPILDQDTHEALVALFNDPARGVGRPGPKPRWLLSNIARCGRCGSGLHGLDRASGKATYRCPGVAGCGGNGILGAPLEAFVVEAVLHRLEASAFPDTDPLLNENIDKLNAAVVVIDGKRRALAADLADDKLNASSYSEAVSALDQKRADLIEQRDELTRQRVGVALPMGAETRRVWADADLDQRRAILNGVIAKLTVAPAHRRKPPVKDRVEIDWRG